jgi:septum formation protein
MKFVLASGSPRRKQLLETCGVRIDSVMPPRIPEEPYPGEEPADYCARLAREKASAVDVPGAWILAADTVVAMDGELFEKPTDDADAERMLSVLSKGWHLVVSAWCLRHSPIPGDAPLPSHSGRSLSEVRFRNLGKSEIRSYVSTGEGRDKAGSYGIQGLGAALVEEIRGSYSNIVGLPMQPVLDAMRKEGLCQEEE